MICCGKCHKHFRHTITSAGTKYQKPVWLCPTFNIYGKEACDAQRIPDDILQQKTYETLGLETLEGIDLHDYITEIVIPDKNILVYVFKDGTEKRVEWQHRSRRESWTPEMKEHARQQMLARHAVERKKKGENHNGS